MRIRKILVISALLLHTALMEAQEIKTVHDVLQANITATGGAEAWRKVSSIDIKESITMTSGTTSTKQSFHRIKKFPGFTYSKSVADYPNLYVETLVRGTAQKLVQTTKRNDKIENKELSRFESYLTASTELNMLEDKLYKLGKLETEKLEDGTECWVFEVSYHESDPNKRYYNKKTLLLQAFTAYSRSNNPDVATKTIIKRVLEHKQEAGLLFPSKISYRPGAGQSLVEMLQVTESITLNPAVDDKIFIAEYIAD